MINNKKCKFLDSHIFCNFALSFCHFFLQNCDFWKTNLFTYFTVTSKLLTLQRHKIPHFKALDKYFWPLAWVLTVGANTFVKSSKMSVLFFYPYFMSNKDSKHLWNNLVLKEIYFAVSQSKSLFVLAMYRSTPKLWLYSDKNFIFCIY